MNNLTYKWKIASINRRYFVSIPNNKNSSVRHFADCNIYAVKRRFCSCGLIHDLQYLDFALAKIIYEKYEKDLTIHEGRKNLSKRKQEECIKILEEVFGKFKKPNIEDIKEDYDLYKKLLKTTWSKAIYPQVFNRLELWLKEQLANRD